MISKLKRRYFISNMALLSTTFLIGLAVLFGILYQSEVKSSYQVMNNLLEDAPLAEGEQNAEVLAPTAFPADGGNEWQYQPPEWNNPQGYWWETQPASESSVTTTTTTTTTTSVTESSEAEVSESYPSWDNNFWWQYNPWYFYGSHSIPPYFQFPNDNMNWNDAGTPQPPDDKNPPNDPQKDEKPVPEEKKQSEEIPHTPEKAVTTTTTSTTSTAKTTAVKPSIGGPIENPPVSQESKVHNGPAAEHPQHTAPQKTTQSSVATTSTEAPLETEYVPAIADTEPVEVETAEESTQYYSEGQYIPDAYVAQFDTNGNIESYASSDEEAESSDALDAVSQAMNQIQKNGGTTGTLELNDISYRFLYQPDTNGSYRLVLLNRTLELSTISRLIFFFLLLMVLGLAAIIAISELLANWTVKPIAAAWEKQKQFVADASHELKTPLAVISANTEVILSDPSASVTGQSKWIHYIQSETNRMSKLITNLLSIARMDNKNDVEKLANIHLSELVSNVCLVFEPIIFENGKTLNTVIQRNVSIQADEDNVKQLLSILLDNAVLHSVADAQITVTLSKDVQGKIRLAVSNTAEDIPQEQLAHLFDRFYRVDTAGSPSGSGLGLSIAKSIVQQMGGSLTVSSENRLVTFVATF